MSAWMVDGGGWDHRVHKEPGHKLQEIFRIAVLAVASTLVAAPVAVFTVPAGAGVGGFVAGVLTNDEQKARMPRV